MDHQQLAERIEKKIDERFTRLEQKLDAAIAESTTNTADVKWLKSFVKTSIGIYVTLFAGVFTSLIKHFLQD